MFLWDMNDNHVSLGSERQGLTKITKSDKNDNICMGIIKCYTPKGLTKMTKSDKNALSGQGGRQGRTYRERRVLKTSKQIKKT